MSPDHNGNAGGKADSSFSADTAALVAAASKFPNFNFSSLGNGKSASAASALNLSRNDDTEYASRSDLISHHLQGNVQLFFKANHLVYLLVKRMGHTRPLFGLILFFSNMDFTEKLQTLAGFKLASSDMKARSTQTLRPQPARPAYLLVIVFSFKLDP